MKSILFMLIIIITFSEGKSQNKISFLTNEFINFVFPKDPGIIKVRRMDRAERMDTSKVLDFIGLVEQYNYPAEEHNVTTEDGYNLIIYRIPGSPLLDSKNLDSKKKNRIVFFLHGLLASSDYWVLYGPSKDLVFLLADQGYDVWVGNMRGNSYCRSHMNMTIDNPKFWQYSFHEVGTKDLPAVFDYILNYTKQNDLYYICHSMGCTSLLVLLSSKPEYNMKIKLAIMLAPAGWNTKLPFIDNAVLKEILREREIYNVFPQCLATVTIGRLLCNDNALTQNICITVFFLLFGPDPAQLNTTTLPDTISHFPAGTSVQAIDHFYQNMRINEFRSYDYEVDENYKRYKQKTAPSYDLKKITAPAILFYSAKDTITTEESVLELGERLPNVLLMEKVQHELFNHIDFIWAIDAKNLLYDRVLELLKKCDNK